MRVAALGFALVVGAVGCGNKKRGLAGINSGLPGGDLPDACAVVQDGCPCSEEGATLACGTVKEKFASYVICREGVRTCSSGVWGECVADHEEKRPLSYRAPMQGGYATLGQGTPMSCGNLCDPGCQETDDDGDGLVVDPDLSAGPDGVTLPPQSAGGNCEDVEVKPDTATITITSITSGAIVATPNNGKIDFDATCSGGAAVEPSWTIDSYDRAVVSAHGVVTVYSGVAGPIKVKGSTASDSDTSTLTVKVVAGDTPIAAGTTTEVGKTLYPYNNTLFPLGLKAPLVQWSEGGITPTKVQVLLCYPKDTCTTFQYAKTFPTAAAPSVPEPRDGALDNTVPAWQIPQEIWSAFDQTAAGDTGQIIIRRQAGSTKYKQLSIDVQFAKDALRGTVYYTQYLRTLHTSASGQTITYSSSAYVPGQICEVGNSTHPSSTAGSQTRAIDLSTSAATNIDPFAKGGYTAGCPVCHSVSADGGTVVSGGQNWQTSGGGNALGIDDIGLDAAGAPKFTGLFAAPNYSVASTNGSESSGEDSRGFSYAAISPDGALVLQGPTFWGSTQGTPSSNNIQSPNLLGVAGAPKPYFFSKTDTPNPGMGVQFATTGALPAYTASGSGSTYTLTASAVGALTIDGVSMSSTSYSVLVKDESGGNAKNNGIYTVSQVGSGSAAWKLKLRSDAYSAGSIKPDGEVRVSDGVLNRSNVYYISSPASGTITPGSTALTFSQRVYPAMVMGTAARTADYATTGVLTPPTVLQSGNVLTGGYAAGLVVDGHTMAVGETLLVKDQGNQAQNGTYTLTQLGVGGVGAPTTASYATTAALPANTNSSGVLTGTAGAPLPAIDGITPASGDTILVKNEGAQANNGIYTVTTVGVGGTGTPLAAARCATTAALPANTNAAGTLTPTSWGAIPTVDGCTLAVGDRLLVKNEGTAANNGVFTVTQLGTGNTNVHTAAKVGTTGALPANTNTAGVLTATAFGVLPTVDGQTLAVNDRVLVMNEGTAANNGIYVVTSLGTPAGASHSAVRVATTSSLPTNVATLGTTLTASAFGALPAIDGQTLVANDRVLVKNEITQANNGIYTVTNPGLGSGTTHTAALVATTAALPGYTATSTTLTATSFGPFPSIDGQTLAVGNRVLVKNEATTANNGIYTVTSLGAGTSVAHANARVATTGTLANNTATATTLTANSNGALGTIDGVSLAVGDRVLVKNEGTQSKNGIYTVTNLGSGGTKWVLTRATDADLTGELLVGDQVPVTSGTANGGLGFYISTPATGIITIGTTNIGFTTSPKWVLTRAESIAVSDLFPVTNGLLNAGVTFYVSTPASGTIVAGTTGIAFSTAVKWVLTRAGDADLTGDLLPADLVPVTSGTTNGGSTFYLSTPASGTIIIGTTAIGFNASVKWAFTRAADTIAAGDQFPVTSGTANGAKTFYVSTPASGAITLNTTPLGFSQSSKWSLTRVTDADASLEVFPGLQVPVTTGTANGGDTFYISSPASGTITVNTTSITFTQAIPWQLTRKSPYDAAGGALDPGLQVTVSSGTANAGKTFYISSPSFGTITVNTTPITWSLGSSWQLTRTANADATGEITPGMEVQVANGAVNAGRVFSVSSPTSGTITINTTPIAFSYGLPSMMAPVMSPDGKKIAYVNGDADVGGGVAETGWRRGLTMFNFDQATMAVSNKKRLINNWNASTPGTPVKWPFFEGDSRSLLYVETDPNEYCSSLANSGRCSSVGTDTYAAAACSGDSGSTSVNTNLERACYQAAYGSMSPTTRGFWPGRIFSIDTSAANPATTRKELSNLNDAEDASDADKAYQPTVLPFTAGGKRWVIFTSPRAYGNQFNQKSSSGTPTDLSCAASMLWVSALDDQTASTADRSHPAFFMPGQQVAKITATTHYVNERGYLVPSPCKATGTSCGVDEECCGYDATPSPTAACRAPSGWDPATGAPAKKCAALSGTCSNKGESCATSADCCNMASCVNFACETAGSYEAATFTREYVAECPTGQLPRWLVYTYHLTTGGDSKLTFSAQTSDNLDDLDAAKVVTLGSSTSDVVSPAAPESIDLGAAFDAAGVSKYLTNLRMLVKLEPSSDGLIAPILRDWQVRYTCEDAL